MNVLNFPLKNEFNRYSKIQKSVILFILFTIIINLLYYSNIISFNPIETQTYSKECKIPYSIEIPKSNDGSYTPPGIHPSLMSVIHSHINTDEYKSFCNLIDSKLDTITDTWDYNSNGECGNWQEDYIKLHKESLNQIENYKLDDFSSKTIPRFISYICQEVPKDSNRGCGGLADRMSGMISTFFYGLLTNRAYLLNWAPMNPLPLEAVWERPFVDWSHDPMEMESLFTNDQNPHLGYQKVDTLNKKWKILTQLMFPDGGNTNFDDLWNGTYVEVRSNRGYIIRTFQLSEFYKERLNEMGLTKENTFRCITNFLFRPTIGSRRFLNAYKTVFQMESVLSIGIQIRTDDHALLNPNSDTNGLDQWGHFLKCAGELAAFKKTEKHQHVVFFLVTDSWHLRKEFIELNHNKTRSSEFLPESLLDISSMVITGLPIEHVEPDQIAKYIDPEQEREVNLARMLPGVNSAYMENWLLGETQYRVISIQGYGKMATFYSGKDRTSISMPKPRLNQSFPVCNTEDVFTTYDWLSTQWSLG